LRLFAFGLGYSARRYVARLDGVEVGATVRSSAAAEDLRGLRRFAFDSGRGNQVAPPLAGYDTLLVSIPPDQGGDPTLRFFKREIAATRWRTILYLSTIGVYGDHGGAWVDETSETRTVSARSQARLAAEREWLALSYEIGAPLHILRIAGIYGPGRNVLIKIVGGAHRTFVRPGQVFNRIHVDDLAGAIGLILQAQGDGEIWNIADDEPAPPEAVAAFAAGLLGVAAPAAVPFDCGAMDAIAASFYEESKRASNAKLKRVLGWGPKYPTYREGLTALAADIIGARQFSERS
jgi:nucleoside-diphosphate-sugar epimerase